MGFVVAALGLQSTGLGVAAGRLHSHGIWALLLQGVWNLPGPGIESVSLHWQVDSYPLDH